VAAESDAVASLVMGIIGIVLSGLLAGLICGPMAISRAKRARSVLDEENHNYWIGLAGIITGAIGLAVSALVAIIYLITIVGVVAYNG